MGDDAGSGQWLTYDEIAAARGIKRIGAVRWVQRHKWRRQAGNDGLARVLVPPDALQLVTRPSAPVIAGDVAGSSAAPSDLAAGALAALETAVMSLTARAEAAERGRDDERQRADDLRTQIATLHVEMEVMRAGLEADLEDARAEAQEAAKAVEVMKVADDSRRAAGLLARLRAAWRRR